jgi:GH25 family lysozyme M1 (1,4-beta-N-acetylmuramidase)
VTIFGPDISHWQSGFDVARAAQEGCEFIIGKVSEGSGFRDPQWPKTRDAAHQAGLLLVGYHYVTTEDPAKQAALCASWLGDRSIPLALDWEDRGGNGANLLRVLKAFRDAGLNMRLIYTGHWYWQEQGSPDLSAAGLPLWSSRYPNANVAAPAALYPRVPTSYWSGFGGLQTALLQFSKTASIAGAKCDVSAFRGTRDELAALLGGTAPDQQEDDMTDEDRKMLREVHEQLTALVGPWGGGLSDKEPGDPDNPAVGYNLLQYVLRNNVEIHQVLRELQGAAPAGGPVVLTESDRTALATQVADLLAERLKS